MKKTILERTISGIKLTSFSFALACAFLCGNEAQCMMTGNNDISRDQPSQVADQIDDSALAQSLTEAFNGKSDTRTPIN